MRNMALFLELLKLIIELLIIIFVSKNLLVPTLRKLGERLNLKPHTIGNISGIATSIPEFITFIESQKFHKNNNEKLGVIEASNNLLVSNTLNLFVIQSISIIIIKFLV